MARGVVMDGDDDGWSVTSVAFQSVQLAGISEHCHQEARRAIVVHHDVLCAISGNERPSNGCRSRKYHH